MKTRIVWNQEEKRILFNEYARLKNEQPDLNNEDRFVKMQAVLAEERRRPQNSSSVWSFNKEFNSEHHRGSTIPPAVSATEAKSNREALVSVPDRIIEVEKVVVREPDYGHIPTVTLARILLERLANLERENHRITGFLSELERQRKAEHAYDRRVDPRPPQEQPPEEALRICIVGLLPGQQREVEERTAGVSKPIKLRFYDSNSGSQEFPMRVDYIIVCSHTNHAWWNKAKATVSSDCLFFIETGIGAVVQKIYDLSSRQRIQLPPEDKIPVQLTPS
ncbi:MAG: hypothetical protein KGL39_45695 [Patescibacteria group bacterium]|nr:hypothetical protein [Patescibacteria group bacterium]